MKFTLKAGIALAALTGAVAIAGSTNAADLGGVRGGSMKDGYMAPMPEIMRGAGGPCYMRADVGYGWAEDPSITWPVNNDAITGHTDAATGTFVETGRTSTFLTDQVTNTSRDNGAFGEIGAGCSSNIGGPGRALRGEIMFGYHGDRIIEGEPGNYSITYTDDGLGNPPPADQPVVNDPLHTSVQSYTMMLNVYKDLGQFGRVTPYVGAGIGAAYNMVDETYFTGNVNLVNRIEGHNDLSFAWSLMAGVGYQVTDRAIVDFGYRYLDMGSAETGRVDSAGFVNPKIKIDDLSEHEIKIGLRYSFGGGDCCAQQYAPMK